jgi:microcompartment protein CcmK/EutM
VVATRKDEKLEGLRMLLVENLDLQMRGTGSFVVAVDAVGAGVGEVVLYASGSSARMTAQTEGKPCDATIMAIVDLVDAADAGRLYEKD